MSYNNIFTIKQKISVDDDLSLAADMAEAFEDISRIYSYIIFRNYNDDKFLGWILQFNIAQIDEYNTLSIDECVREMLSAINDDKKVLNCAKYVIHYKQPSLELQIKVYDPFIRSISKKLSDQWMKLEYEDLYQDCRLCLIMLYNKGYYIHARLLYRTLNNYILMQLRHFRNEPVFVNLDDVVRMKDTNEKHTIADVIPDVNDELEKLENEEDECKKQMLRKFESLMKSFVSERTYNELLRDYGNKHTKSSTVKLVQNIKAELRRRGIDSHYFDDCF